MIYLLNLRSSNKRFAWLLSLVFGSIILSINIKLKEIDSNKFAVDVLFEGEKKTLRIDSVSGAHLIDKISFANVTGGFESVYFSTDAKVRADGVSLNFVRDFRFLPAPTGSDLVFIRPLLAQTIEIDPGTMAIGSEHTRPVSLYIATRLESQNGFPWGIDKQFELHRSV